MKCEVVALTGIIAGPAGFFLSAKLLYKYKYLSRFALIIAVAISLVRIVKVSYINDSLPELRPLIQTILDIGDFVWFAFSFLLIGIASAARKKNNVQRLSFYPLFHSQPMDLWGASAFNAGLFFYYAIGKLKHWREMEIFFQVSGYPFFFAHVTTVLECLLSIILMAPLPDRVKKIAAWTLFAEMLGAVFTHVRNSDPFSDSGDALVQLAVLGVLLYWIYGKPNRGLADNWPN